ncbi:DegT/DnrJ/EryC1/StrS family aminotransferase [Candidatus Albibeggiatoa sp. nov. NOAA]|uniref:DegT/DnrJ/EryC1/StrS family aminotransferase n=1 Tax=Candidatus Albibeggiatoa sp. nov. NOAA TaxID=3162724 RepID=UPI0032FB2923|nr:DegT/DnrJ/EryC1/StrS family aminotransferase [Thiotrichaceae bacterium]
MSLNVVLDAEIILDLLSLSKNDTQHAFTRLQKSLPIRFWIPCSLLPILEQRIFPNQHNPLTELLQETQLLSSLAVHWTHIPCDCTNKTQALISLDASTLPGSTIIWTQQEEFETLSDDIEAGDHEFVYAMLAEYEYEMDDKTLFDLETAQLLVRDELEANLFNVLKQGEYVLGHSVLRLEQALSQFVETQYCVATASGHDALLLALQAVGTEPEDEVITTPFAPPNVLKAILALGAIPVFVDIDPETYNLNPEALNSILSDKIKAVIPVNVYGQCADFDTINHIAMQHKIPVIEDASCSFGASYRERPSGQLGLISCTSFAPTHPFGGYGHGGACFTNDTELAVKLSQLRHFETESIVLGMDNGMNSIQASMLLAKLNIFPQEIQARQHIAQHYHENLVELVKIPYIAPDMTNIYAYYTIEVDKRDKVREALKETGITTGAYYRQPLHLHPAITYLGYKEQDFPNAESAAAKVLNLPMHAYLAQETQDDIIQALKKII